MDQPIFRYQNKADQTKGLSYMPVYRVAVVSVTANAADIPILRVDAGTFVRCFARVTTALDGSSPTIDIGLATDPDALVANTALASTLNAVAQSAQPIFFAAAGNVTIDIGGSGTTAGEVVVVFELFNMDTLETNPYNTATVA